MNNPGIRFAAGALAIICILMLNGCGYETTLVQELKSPNEEVIAYVYRTDGGATTAFSYDVYIVPKDAGSDKRKFSRKSRVLQIMRTRGFELEWESNSLLVFKYIFARGRDPDMTDVLILEHRNYVNWDDAEKNWQRTYFLLEAQDDEDFSN